MDQTTGDMRTPDPNEGVYIQPISETADTRGAYVEERYVGSDVSGGNLGAADAYDVNAEQDVQRANEDQEGADTGAIRDDIESTRANMSETINAIEEKLSPQRLTQQAKDVVHDATIGRVEHAMNDMTDSAREGGHTLLDTVRQNPIPVALAGIGLGWLIMETRQTANERSARQSRRYQGGRYYPDQYGSQYGNQYGQQYRGQYGGYAQPQRYGAGYTAGGYTTGYQGTAQSTQDSSPSLTDRAQDKLGQAQDKLGQVTDQVQNAGGQLQDQAQQVAGQIQDQAQYQMGRARGWFADTMDDNPLAIGLIALGVGALTGFALPETDKERQVMGSASSQVMQKAQDVAQDTAQKAQQVAQRATEAAKDTAKDEAKRQNLVQ